MLVGAHFKSCRCAILKCALSQVHARTSGNVTDARSVTSGRRAACFIQRLEPCACVSSGGEHGRNTKPHRHCTLHAARHGDDRRRRDEAGGAVQPDCGLHRVGTPCLVSGAGRHVRSAGRCPADRADRCTGGESDTEHDHGGRDLGPCGQRRVVPPGASPRAAHAVPGDLSHNRAQAVPCSRC